VPDEALAVLLEPEVRTTVAKWSLIVAAHEPGVRVSVVPVWQT